MECSFLTTCLEGRRSCSRRSPALHRPYSRFHTVYTQCERAWQKMSCTFFTPFGKTCRVFLLMISPKDVAFFCRQEVTMLPGGYYTSFSAEGQGYTKFIYLPLLFTFRWGFSKRSGYCYTTLHQGDAFSPDQGAVRPWIEPNAGKGPRFHSTWRNPASLSSGSRSGRVVCRWECSRKRCVGPRRSTSSNRPPGLRTR